jgi:hypothetical protein
MILMVVVSGVLCPEADNGRAVNFAQSARCHISL